MVRCPINAQRQSGVSPFIVAGFDRRVAKRLDIDGNGTWDRYEIYVWADGQEVMRIVDSDGIGAQPYRIANRYLWGPGVDQLLSDEQYATGTGFQIGSTTATTSTLARMTLLALADNLGSVRSSRQDRNTSNYKLVERYMPLIPNCLR